MTANRLYQTSMYRTFGSILRLDAARHRLSSECATGGCDTSPQRLTKGISLRRPAISPFNHVFTAMVVGLLISSALIVTFKIRERDDAIDSARRYASQVADILAEQVGQSALSVDLTLDSVIANTVDRASTGAFLAKAETHATYDFLVGALSRLPQSDVITITDSSGKMLASTRGRPHPAVDLSDRDYFKFFRNGGDGLFVSAPVHNKVTRAWTVYFVKKISSGAGDFLGLALIGVRPEIFIQSRKTLATVQGQGFSLFRRDGVVLLRRDDDRDHTGDVIPANSNWHEIVSRNGGTYRSPGYFDGVPRQVAVAPIKNYPLVVDVAIDEEHILIGWRSRALRTLEYFAGAFCAMVLLLAALHREHKRVIANERELRAALQTASDNAAIVEHQAMHDPLTGLNNRAAFVHHLHGIRSSTPSEQCALFLLDLDGFKLINDTFGHDIGDQLLKEAATRLQGMSSGQFVARLGGDEFVYLHDRPNGEDWASALATRLLTAISAPYAIEGRWLTVEASIGVKLFDSSSCDFRRVMRRADLALNEAKRQGRNCFKLFDAAMDATFQLRVALADELRSALLRNELQVFYQPIVRSTTREVVKREALVRWFHPSRGVIPPDVFIPLAEEIGLIGALGNWVLRTACLEARTWTDDAKVSVNVSPLQFAQGDIVEQVSLALSDSLLPARRLEIEITESVFLQTTEKNFSRLHDLRSAGVDIALDDFGTGYASLSYMKCFPFSNIKIDRSFINDAHRDSSSMAIITATVGLARALDLSTTAEGVETEEQCALLCAAGIDNMQGYLFGRPEPVVRPRPGDLSREHKVA